MSAISLLPTIFAVRAIASVQGQARGSLVGALGRANGAAAAGLVNRTPAHAAAELRSTVQLRQEFARQLAEAQKNLGALDLPPVDLMRTATVVALENTPFQFDTATIAPLLESVRAAETGEALIHATATLVNAIEEAHGRQFTGAVSVACKKASESLGFGRVETELLADRLRVIATDTSGRCLISEITTTPGAEHSVETEVVGVRDGSCVELLEAFDAALEREGVLGAGRRRRSTGGVAQGSMKALANSSADLFGGRRRTAAKSDEAQRRIARLNTPRNVRAKGR